MGTSIIIQGADFSGSSLGNAFYPSYENLVAARFYGDKIPDVTAYKKSKEVGAVLAGGPLVTSDYALDMAVDQSIDSGLTLPSSFTLIAVIEPEYSTTSTTHRFLNTAAGPNLESGKFNLFFWSNTSEDRVRMGGLGTVNLDAGVPRTTNISRIAVISSDASALTRTVRLYSRGQLVTATGTTPAPFVSNSPIELQWTTGGSNQFRHLAVFNKALDAAEVQGVIDYLRLFYGSKGVDI